MIGRVLVALLAASWLPQALAFAIPCNKVGLPAGCSTSRITACTACPAVQDGASPSTAWCVEANSDYQCWTHVNPLNKSPGSIPTTGTALNQNKNAKWYHVKFDDGTGGTCRQIIMQMGESWGTNPTNGAGYGCQGRCGAGCPGATSFCSNYAQDCLKHDVCSWYHSASGGSGDANCGDEYNQAAGDTTANCLTANRCETNKANYQGPFA